MTCDMDAKNYLSHCALLGAGGKMGRGIALLLLEKGLEELLFKETLSSFTLVCVDKSEAALHSLRQYLREQLRKRVERTIVTTRKELIKRFDLVSNEDVVNFYLEKAEDALFFSTSILAAADSPLVFEALPEKIDLKKTALQQISEVATCEQYYLTNTSSIPVSLLSENPKLKGKVVGFHFYNPAPVQPLVEIIEQGETDLVLKQIVKKLITHLHKKVVYSSDRPGFIGNGFFIRQVAFFSQLAKRFSPMVGEAVAIFALDLLSRDWLLRPMGLFELIDYVGVDVCSAIGEVMAKLTAEVGIRSCLIEELLSHGKKGGLENGERQEGFFCYDHKAQIIGVWDKQEGSYSPINDDSWQKRIEAALGPLPNGHKSWSSLKRLSEKERVRSISCYLQNLAESQEMGAQIAKEILTFEQMTAKLLVSSGIAASENDVNKVMQLGFGHLYGPFQ